MEGNVPYEYSEEPEGEYKKYKGIYFNGKNIQPKETTMNVNLQNFVNNVKFLNINDLYKPLFFGDLVVLFETNIYNSEFANGNSTRDTAIFTMKIIKLNKYCITRKINFTVGVEGHCGGVSGIRSWNVEDEIFLVEPNAHFRGMFQNKNIDENYIMLISRIAYLYFLGSQDNDYFKILPNLKLEDKKENKEYEILKTSVPFGEIYKLQEKFLS